VGWCKLKIIIADGFVEYVSYCQYCCSNHSVYTPFCNLGHLNVVNEPMWFSLGAISVYLDTVVICNYFMDLAIK
jgi:hypothetical protein